MTSRKSLLRSPILWLILSIIGYIGLFITLTLWKYHHFYYDNLDLAIFNQVFYTTLHGMPFAATIHPPSYLGDHFSPFIYFLLPLYAIAQSPTTLLILQTITLGLTALPVFFIAKNIVGKKHEWLACGAALLWLTNPLVHNMNFFEFELTPFVVIGLFWMFYCYQKKNTTGFIVLALLTLLVREDAALMIVMFSLLAVLQKRDLFWKLFPFISAFVYSCISFPVISHFAPNGSYKFLVYYGWLGGTTPLAILWAYLSHPLQFAAHFLTVTNLEFILGLGFPLFYMGYLPSICMLFLIPPAAQILLGATGGSALILMTHYSGYFLIGLFLVMLDRINRIEQDNWPHWFPKLFRNKKALYGIMLLASVYGAVTYGSIIPAVMAWTKDNQQTTKQNMVAKIPANASVATTFELLTPLSTRDSIYGLNYILLGKNQFAQSDYALPENTEYILIDWQDIVTLQMHVNQHHTFSSFADRISPNLEKILHNYSLISAEGSLTLWKKSQNPSTDISLLASYDTIDVFRPIIRPTIESIEDNGQTARAVIALPDQQYMDRQYYLLITTYKRSYTIPLAYALPQQGTGPAKLTMTLFIGKDEQASLRLDLYKWHKAYAKLSNLKNIERVSDAEIVQTFPLTLNTSN